MDCLRTLFSGNDSMSCSAIPGLLKVCSCFKASGIFLGFTGGTEEGVGSDLSDCDGTVDSVCSVSNSGSIAGVGGTSSSVDCLVCWYCGGDDLGAVGELMMSERMNVREITF